MPVSPNDCSIIHVLAYADVRGLHLSVLPSDKVSFGMQVRPATTLRVLLCNPLEDQVTAAILQGCLRLNRQLYEKEEFHVAKFMSCKPGFGK